jgi:thioredoxin-related protein
LKGIYVKSIFLSVILLIPLSILLCSAQTTGPVKTVSERHSKFDPARDAGKDIEDAVAAAKKEHKRIILDVGGEWCIWCHRLDSLFIRNKDLEAYLEKHYVVVKINVSKENYNKELLSKYPKVAGYPHLFVLNENGELLKSQDTGELEYPKEHPVKGHDKAKVMAFLKKWAK